jgi:uncharacterized membrane protein YidH (DUF202 family)
MVMLVSINATPADPHFPFCQNRIAVTQLFWMNMSQPDKPTGGRALGAYLIVMGIVFLLFAAVRFFHCQEAMVRGLFPVTSNVAIVTSLMLLIVCLALLFLN